MLVSLILLNIDYFIKFQDMTFIRPEYREKFEHHDRQKRLALNSAALWENGYIPYSFSSHYSSKKLQIMAFNNIHESIPSGHQQSEIIRAMSEYEEKTCLRFVEHTDERDSIRFFKGSG